MEYIRIIKYISIRIYMKYILQELLSITVSIAIVVDVQIDNGYLIFL